MRIITLSLIIALTAGCNDSENAKATEDQIKALTSKVSKLSAEVELIRSASKENEELNQRWEVEQHAKILTLESIIKPYAILDASTNKYAVGSYDLGPLIFSINDISAYAKGSKLILEIGNPLTIDVSGLKASIGYSSNAFAQFDDTGSPCEQESGKCEKTIQHTFSEKLMKGESTKAILIIPDMPPSELAYIKISNISHTGVSMLRRND